MNTDTIIPPAKTSLVIVADLGLLRAYRKIQGQSDRQPHLELVDELRPEAAHQKVSDLQSDQAGRFAKGSGAGRLSGDLSSGEQHDLELEQHRRLIKLLAGKINDLLADVSVATCSVAASAPILRRLLEQRPCARRLLPRLRSTLRSPIPESCSHILDAMTDWQECGAGSLRTEPTKRKDKSWLVGVKA